MGVLLIGGFAVIVTEIVRRIAENGEPAEAISAPSDLDLPEGAVVQQSHTTDNRLILRIRLAEGGERLLFLDEDGRLVRRIDLRAAAGEPDLPR